jgi:hypothetical protein
MYLTLSRETQAHQVGLLFGGRRPSRKNRAGDCGDTNASGARANPPFDLTRFGAPFLSGNRNFRLGWAAAADRTRTDTPRVSFFSAKHYWVATGLACNIR